MDNFTMTNSNPWSENEQTIERLVETEKILEEVASISEKGLSDSDYTWLKDWLTMVVAEIVEIEKREL
jgi:hypothetical protein